jgi:hypothetical protein
VGGTCGKNGREQKVYRLLVGKPEGKRPLGRPRSRRVDNIKIYPVEIRLCSVNWIGVAQKRYRWRDLVNAVMNLRAPLDVGKVSSDCTAGGLSSSAQLHRVRTGKSAFANAGYVVSVVLMCVIELADRRTDGCLIRSCGLNSKSILWPFRLLLAQSAAIKGVSRHASRYSGERPAGTVPLDIPRSEVSFRKSF